MNRPVSTKMIALAILGLMVASACGQKPGVADEPVPGFAAAGGLEGAQIDPETGGIIDPETGQIIDPETGEVIGTVGSSGAGGSTTSSGPSSSGTGSGGDGPGAGR